MLHPDPPQQVGRAGSPSHRICPRDAEGPRWKGEVQTQAA